jgi:platelet-activating factor acetylhydrolase isoform II
MQSRLSPVVPSSPLRELGLVYPRRLEQGASGGAVVTGIVAGRQVVVAPRHLAFRVISKKRHRHACSSWQLPAAHSVNIKFSGLQLTLRGIANGAADTGLLNTLATRAFLDDPFAAELGRYAAAARRCAVSGLGAMATPLLPKRSIPLDARDAMTVDSYDYDANCRHWPDVVGQFPVGTLEFEVTDALRNSQYAPNPTDARRLYVRAWYPAGDVAGYHRRPYFTDAEINTVPVMSLQLLRQPPDALRNAVRLLTNAHVGAPPATGKFPVAVFNHGYLSYPAQHTALFEHLAANGYVVLSLGHPWESG